MLYDLNLFRLLANCSMICSNVYCCSVLERVNVVTRVVMFPVCSRV